MDEAVRRHGSASACAAAGGVAAAAPPDIVAYSLPRLLAGDAAVRAAVLAALEERSWVVLRAGASELRTLRRAEGLVREFFGRPEAELRRHEGKRMPLVTCGYSRHPTRQQWHLACAPADRDAQPSPSAELSHAVPSSHTAMSLASPPMASRPAAASSAIVQIEPGKGTEPTGVSWQRGPPESPARSSSA